MLAALDNAHRSGIAGDRNQPCLFGKNGGRRFAPLVSQQRLAFRYRGWAPSRHMSEPNPTGRTIASRYCDLKQTASGQKVTCQDLIAAHRSWAFGKRIKVRNLANARTVTVTVTVTIVDRGPFVKGRIIDLSAGAANAIGSADLMRVELTPE